MKPSLERLIQSLTEGLIERDAPSRLILLAALAGEHTLLVGPPGTAKSVLARKLHNVFSGGEYFERLLTRFSVPEELFGPLSIKALEDDQYHRLTDHYLPAASIAFIDEIFKANSAILNSLLTILNEGEFDNGTQRVKVPLISVVAASNELPSEGELEALYDRFLVRYQVQPVSEHQFENLLTLSSNSKIKLIEGDKLNPAVIEDIQCQAQAIVLPTDIIQLLHAVRDYLSQNNQYISDRRWRKIVKLLKVSAFTNGQKQVSIWDCSLLQHCLWNSPEQKQALNECYESHLGLGTGFYPERLEKLISTWEASLKADKESEVQRVDNRGHKLYLDQKQQATTEKKFVEWQCKDNEHLYVAPQGQEDLADDAIGYSRKELQEQFFDSHYKQTHIDGRWQHIDEYVRYPENRLMLERMNPEYMEPAKHTDRFVENRVNELSLLQADLKEQKTSLKAFLDSARLHIVEHLWIDSSFKTTAVENLEQSQQQISNLASRIDAVIAGYGNLPRVN
ncbi:MAG: AAA family ATPase [Pseudomonadales bacterium]|nr:AAA family ATPase [Pseudomonadales bacterium]